MLPQTPRTWKSARRWRASRQWAQVISIAFASFFGIYTFWYTEVIGPSRLPAALSVTPRLEQIGTMGDTAIVRASVQIENESQANVHVPAMWYTVRGLRLVPQDTLKPYVRRSPRGQPELHALYSRQEAPTVVASGRFIDHPEMWFQPGGHSQLEEIFLVPARDFDVVQLKVDYALLRSNEGLHEVGWVERPHTVPTFTVQGPGKRLERLQGERYERWKAAHGAAFNWTSTSLSLRPLPVPVPAAPR